MRGKHAQAAARQRARVESEEVAAIRAALDELEGSVEERVQRERVRVQAEANEALQAARRSIQAEADKRIAAADARAQHAEQRTIDTLGLVFDRMRAQDVDVEFTASDFETLTAAVGGRFGTLQFLLDPRATGNRTARRSGPSEARYHLQLNMDDSAARAKRAARSEPT